MPSVVRLALTFGSAALLLLPVYRRVSSSSVHTAGLPVSPFSEAVSPGGLDGGTNSDPGAGSSRIGELSM